jgi:hypothetical protein
MANLHSEQGEGFIHIIHNWTYADAAARTGASGFSSTDIGKIAKQTDTNSWWVLTATTPTWAEITSTAVVGAFLTLTDVDPSTYVGQGGKLVAVNSTPDGLEFIDAPTGDVIGPGPTVTDETLARMDGTGGLTIQASGIAVTDANIMTFPDTHLVRPVLKDYGLEVYAHGSTSGAVALNVENGNIQTVTVTGATTLSITNPTPTGDYCAVTVIITQDGSGSHTVTLPTALWEGASSPTLTTGPGDIDILTFVTVDAGSTWFGFAVGLDMS